MNTENIVSMYKSTKSMSEVARFFKISHAKVRKILISEGEYSNKTIKEVQRLYASGKSVSEIASLLLLSKSCVNSYLPYIKSPYLSDAPSDNALRIRKCRERSKQSP